MRIDYNIHLDYSDNLLHQKINIKFRRDVDILRKFKFRNSGKELTYVPSMASNMDGVGTFPMARVLQEFKMLTVIRKHYTLDDWKQAPGTGLKIPNMFVRVGTGAIWDENAKDYQTLKQVMSAFPRYSITIDVANAYHESFVDFVTKIRTEYPEKVIIAGNVVTPNMTEELIIKGADIVKVGIGPAVCVPKDADRCWCSKPPAIMECPDALNGVGGHIIADGGCTEPGDVAKALGGGAHFVMLGGMLAGHNESELELKDGKRIFYGMAPIH